MEKKTERKQIARQSDTATNWITFSLFCGSLGSHWVTKKIFEKVGNLDDRMNELSEILNEADGQLVSALL